jgi:outer membrane protein OmpA-like peptidoglycan-associated protein
MSNKRQIKKSIVFSAASALMISGVAVNPAAADEIEVTNCLDTGAGSLRDAVVNANYEAVIVFEDLECDTITLNSTIEIPTSLTIVGPGSSELTITNNPSNNNGLFYTDLIGAAISISRVTLTTHSDSYDVSEPLIFSEGETYFSLNSVEVTGVGAYLTPAIAVGGTLRIGESSFHGNRIQNIPLIVGQNVYIANSSFVGNSIFEGTLVGSLRAAVINSAFVDNFPESPAEQDAAQLIGAYNFSSYSSIYAEDFITDEAQFIYTEGEIDDQGSNYYAFGSSVTDVHGITNTTVGNGASVIVSRDDLKLGAFDRVFDREQGLSARHQQLSAGSVAIDSHTFEQFEVANNELSLEFQSYLLANYDAAGDRRPSGPKYDSGPIEYVASSGLTSRSKNVFFKPMSSTLTKEARKALRNMVNNLPDGATVRRINVTGFVQPAGFSWNNKSLSEARAKNVKRFLKTLGVKGQWKIAARGEDKDSTAKARRVKVVVKYDVVPQPPR